MTLGRREFAGAAPQTTLNGDITSGSTTINMLSGTNYPSGAVGNFLISIDVGLANEEKILCSSRTGNVLTVAGGGRGYDNTTAGAHTGQAVIQHVGGAVDFNDNNDHVYTTTRDDHSQYSRTDGTRAFTGAVTVNAGGLTVVAGGATVTAGGLTVSAGTTAAQAVTATTVTGTGEIKGTDFNTTGLTGAVAASRYVGATASGAPGSGTFLLGDYIVDQTGTIWICTTGGTPGTWAMLSKDALAVHLAGTETITGAKTFSAAVQVNATLTSNAEIKGTDFNSTGLTGATQASRYVGATVNGAPTSGTFSVDDFIVDQKGQVWICTTGGTPGTWRLASPTATAKAVVHRAGAFTTAASGTNAMNWDTTDDDPGSNVTLGASGFFNCPIAGYYAVSGQMSVGSINVGDAGLIWKNGAAVLWGGVVAQPGGGGDLYIASGIVKCAVNDHLAFAYVSGGAQTLNTNTYASSFTVCLLSQS